MVHISQFLLQDFEQNLTRELDFTLEACNGEETARQLKHRAPHIYVPKVFKEPIPLERGNRACYQDELVMATATK
jgi:hypothetical protein